VVYDIPDDGFDLSNGDGPVVRDGHVVLAFACGGQAHVASHLSCHFISIEFMKLFDQFLCGNITR